MIRFGLIGLGVVGVLRQAALERSPHTTLTAAFDVDKKALSELPENVKRFSDVKEMLNADVCDAVIISTPTHFHQELVIEALESGKHVIVEKPMASTLDGCRVMHETAKRVEKILTVGFNQRYFPAIKDVRNAIQSGAIGNLRYVKGFAGHTGLSEFKAKWMYDKDIMGGGTLMDNGIHTLDLVCHLMGGVNSASGIVSTDIWQLDRSEDNAFVHLQSDSGVIGTLHSSWTEWKGYHFYVEAYGDKGMARAYYAPMHSSVVTMDKPGGTPKTKRNFYIKSIFREKFFGWQSTVIQSFVDEFADFASLVNGGPAGNIAHSADGVRSIAVPNAVYASHAEKRPIDIESVT